MKLAYLKVEKLKNSVEYKKVSSHHIKLINQISIYRFQMPFQQFSQKQGLRSENSFQKYLSISLSTMQSLRKLWKLMI